MKLLWKLANAIHLGLYRLTSGRIGGRMGDGTILLLTTTGRKTGKARTVPVLYFLVTTGTPSSRPPTRGYLKTQHGSKI